MMTREHIIKISNLRNYNERKIKDSISKLFNNCLNIALNVENVDIGTERQHLYALVYLQTHEEVEQTLDKLGSKNSRAQQGFKFKKLVRPKDELEVEILRFYRLGESLGIKNRTKVYRSGTGDYIDEKLQHDVFKFMCGFLNCAGRGTLYIGVGKKGHVVGLNCDQRRTNRIQSITNKVFSSVRPVIQSNCFSVEFVPVYSSDGHPKGTTSCITSRQLHTLRITTRPCASRSDTNVHNCLNVIQPIKLTLLAECRVVEISVKNVETKCLYSVCEEVYLRHQTCAEGPLKVSEILVLSREVFDDTCKKYLAISWRPVRLQEKQMRTLRQRVQEEMRLECQSKLEQSKAECQSKLEQSKAELQIKMDETLKEEKEKLKIEKEKDVEILQKNLTDMQIHNESKSKVCAIM